LSLDGEAFQVRRVVEGSPASKAGIRENDRIVGVDGVPVGQLTLESVRQRFLEAGKRVVLLVERDGKVRDARVKLRALV
ncbi:MAG: PDZ domain-containing protein, partial [Blastocatellia bacterium]